MIECTKCRVEPGIIAIDADVSKLLCVGCGREQLYESACRTHSDINEHLPVLRALAARCEKVTEFGMRWARGSTVAFLAAQPKQLVSWDIDSEHVLSPRVVELMHIRGRTSFEPRVGNTLDIAPEKTDMIFFDTLHTQKQLLAELMRHVDPPQRLVKKYLAFHDTSTFGMVGEDGSRPGIYSAIVHFQKNESFPLWEVMPLAKLKGHLTPSQYTTIAAGAEKRRDGEPIMNFSNNNGLIVLESICADGHGDITLGGQCRVCAERIASAVVFT